MIYAGIDIAKSEHVVSAVDGAGEQVAKPMPFRNSEDGFERCVAWLEGVAEDPSGVVVGMEATGHYWMACFAFLTARGYIVAVVNPVHVRAVRKLKNLIGVKNDRIDSWLIAETLRLGEYDQTRLATDEVQSLRTLTRYRQALAQETTTVKTQVICLMDAYFPEYEGLFGNMFGAASAALLAKSPLPSEIARMKTPSLARLLKDASHGRFGADKAAEVRAAAKSSVGIRLGERAAAFQVREMVSQLEYLNEKTAKVEREIEALLMRVEPLILTIPGVSVALGSQIVAEIGDVRRFRSAASIVKYAGLNSGVSQSGQFEAQGPPITKVGSAHLRRAMWLAADSARRYDPNLRAYYERKRAEGKCHRVAVTAVARKLCHIVYAVMRDQAPYDPAR